jgi:uncharacterized Tic20 family protein
MSVADDLGKLQELRERGAINDEEFAQAKAKLLESAPSSRSDAELGSEAAWFVDQKEQETRHWACLLHLSILCGFAVPIAGLVTPIVIWQWKKDTLPGIDVHGKNALNWIISKVIYFIISLILVLVIIGIPLLVLLGVAAVVFPIIAGIKANNGEVWKYPLAITFFK